MKAMVLRYWDVAVAKVKGFFDEPLKPASDPRELRMGVTYMAANASLIVGLTSEPLKKVGIGLAAILVAGCLILGVLKK